MSFFIAFVFMFLYFGNSRLISIIKVVDSTGNDWEKKESSEKRESLEKDGK